MFESRIGKPSFFFFSIALSTMVSFSPAHAGSIGPEYQKCVQNPVDPYDPGKLFTYGEFKGKCVDSSQKRAIRILSENDQELVFANFRHMGRFWIAHFPKESIDSVSFRIDPFGSGIPFVEAAHTLLRFDMKPGKTIVLEPQYEGEENGIDPKELSNVNSFFFSVNYMAPKGVSYNLFPGMASVYLEAYNFLSAHDRGNAKQTGRNAEKTLQLNLAPGAGDELILKAFRASDERQLNVAYNTYSENCTTALFDLMDASFDYEHAAKKFIVSHLRIFDELIGPSIQALKKRGLIDENYGKKDAASELGNPIEPNAPEVEPSPAPTLSSVN